MVDKRISNPALKTILPSWPGTPVDKAGRFINHEFPFIQSFGKAFKWMLQTNPQKKIKKTDPWRIPVLKDDSFLSNSDNMIVPLGHASFFIRLGGKQLLVDPVIGTIPANKRFSEFPVTPSKLVNIDYVLVSHAHFDHCDKASLKLIQKQNPKAKFLTGLGMAPLFLSWGNTNEIQEAGWYQQYNLDDELEIFYLPTRHWSNRSLNDINKRLWGAYILKSKERIIYVGADSGYGSHYKEVGELFPGIDVALIGTGAYSPRWFMGPNHQDPEQGVIAFNETKAKVMIPFHYGTFDVSDEPLSEPEQILKQLEAEGKINNKLKLLKIGEPYKVVE
jgi:L-ascorbate metabolism protein UlaG (beta-lactamase superfamily)